MEEPTKRGRVIFDRKPNEILSKTTVIVSPRHAVEELWPIGSLLDGQYHVDAIRGGTGISGMGVVYIIQHGANIYAAKTFQRQFAGDLGLIQRFMREAETWMLIDAHPNIVRAHYLDIIETIPFIFMEYIERDATGCLSLADHIARGRIPLEQAMDFALQCCEGMIHATRAVPGLVHRDLKPENLLISPDGTLKITDFGLVRWHMGDPNEPMSMSTPVPGHDLTQAGTSLGTPAYMAPGQFLEPGRVEIPADIYAWGCVLYEVIAGQRLFTIRSDSNVERVRIIKNAHLHQIPVPLHERAADCPRSVSDIVMKCLEKKPENRWPTFEALRDNLLVAARDLWGDIFRPRELYELSPGEVAQHVRSLALLDGYSKAIQNKALRESDQHSPYSFHLALASYFRSQRDRDEERRQLERALRVRSGDEGHEAVRRLAEVLIRAGSLDDADVLLSGFLTRSERGLHHVIEPMVQLRLAQGREQEARTLIESQLPTERILWLYVEYASAIGDQEMASAVLKDLVDVLITEIEKGLKVIERGQSVGVDFAGDTKVLCDVLAVLCPNLDTQRLRDAEESAWPNLSGYPDFSVTTNWLCKALGELGALSPDIVGDEQPAFIQAARILGYPKRFSNFIRRDEDWIWGSQI